MAVSKAASTAEKKVSWMVDPKADYSAGMLVDCSAVPKAQHSAEPKAEWKVETMAVPKAASTAEKKVSWMVDPKDDYLDGKLVDCSE